MTKNQNPDCARSCDIDCVIFDCDGTLVNSEGINNYALSLKLKQMNIELGIDALMNRFRGKKIETILSEIEHEQQIQLSDQFVPEYRELVNELFEKHLHECDGVTNVLNMLKKPKCIASGAPMAKIRKALEVTSLAQFFDNNIFSSHDINSWKPEPGIFLHAARAMNTEPERCLVVEDSLVGIEAAQKAKMKSILYDPERHFNAPQGIHSIHHMHEVITLAA